MGQNPDSHTPAGNYSTRKMKIIIIITKCTKLHSLSSEYVAIALNSKKIKTFNITV